MEVFFVNMAGQVPERPVVQKEWAQRLGNPRSYGWPCSAIAEWVDPGLEEGVESEGVQPGMKEEEPGGMGRAS